MESRSNHNRTLFESSLELKCLLFFGLGLTVVISASFILYWQFAGAQMRTQNPRTANLLVVQRLTFRHWVTFQGESKNDDPEALEAEFSLPTPPSDTDDFVNFMEVLNNRLHSEQFRSNFLWAPWSFSETATSLTQQNDKRLRPNEEEKAIFDDNIPGKFPLIVKDYDSKNAAIEYCDFIDSDGKYQYYQVIRADNFCSKNCHEVILGVDFEPGEIMGLFHVEIPTPPSNKDALAKYWALLLGGAIVTTFLSLIAFDLVIRWVIIKPLRNLRTVTEAISRGDHSKRAELHTGDEFESLGEAFNRMLRILVSAREKQRKANMELESNLDELAHLSQRLLEANRVKSDFMATMSHELRTPLNSILGFSEVLGSIESLDEKQKRYVGNINKSGRTLLNMINDILDMAKMESGRMNVTPSQFPVARIVLAQCDMAKPLSDKKNIELLTIIEPDLPPMLQDESRIQQILNNLLSNAIKFTPEGGRIKCSVKMIQTSQPLATSPEHTWSGRHSSSPAAQIQVLEMQVSDNGVGISEDDQQVVFDKFRQGKSGSTDGDAIKREHSGSGLGLSIVKEICKMLEGEISLESQIGLGTTFTVRLPWTLDQRDRGESEMMTRLQEFSKNRILKLAQKPTGAGERDDA